MLTVWCLWWRDPANPDKYSEYHVRRLQASVAINLPVTHRFVCMTKERVEGVTTIAPPGNLPGWWQKVLLFKPGFAADRNVYFDLDVVITCNVPSAKTLEPIAAYADCELAAAANWAQSGHGGIQSSVMAWNGKLTLPFTAFDPRDAHWPPVNKPGTLWGDQEWLTKLRDRGDIDWTPIPEQYIKSYKYHCRDGLPEDCRVTVWHGDPKPGTPGTEASWYRW